MSNYKPLTCFKAYDVRGKLDEELNEEIAYRIGRATAQFLNANTVVVGFDSRATSADLAQSLGRGICHAGANVLDIGLAGTEEMYAALVVDLVDAKKNKIEYMGDPEAIREYIHVIDAARSCIEILNKEYSNKVIIRVF